MSTILKNFMLYGSSTQNSKSRKAAFEKIERSKLIFVEGADDLNLIYYLLKSINKHDVQIVEIGGYEKFQKVLPPLPNQNSQNQMVSLALIVDNDNREPDKTFEDLLKLLNSTAWQPPDKLGKFSEGVPRIGIYTLPNLSEKGTLENLFLDSIKENEHKVLAKQYCNDIQSSRQAIGKKTHSLNQQAKITSTAYLLSTDEPDTRVGLSAGNQIWDLTHPAMDELTQFLRQL